MRNFKLIIEYDGTKYNGWQKQGNTQNTIQSKLENILHRFTGKNIEINGSGRTDAGVHALNQVANFKVDIDADCKEIKCYINKYLPMDIKVLSVTEVDDRFHARLSAKGKTYRYSVYNTEKTDVFERKYCTFIEDKLDVDSIYCALEMLKGKHDFKAFCSNRRMKKSTIRTIYDIKLVENGNRIDFYFIGDGFLYNMVRIIMGTLIEIGLGKREVSSLETAFKTLNRDDAGYTAPPEGLTLYKVEY